MKKKDKIFFISSVENNNFGVVQVIQNLKQNLSNIYKINKNGTYKEFFSHDYNLIHLHGCWRINLLIYFLLAKVLQIKIYISPHGMLDPESFKNKKIIKLIAWHLYQKFIFKFSNGIIVNSLNEKKNIKKFLNNINIKIIPHGIIPNKEKIIYYKKKGSLKFVFFSRIHPIKNLDKLIDIWLNSYNTEKYSLLIYGDVSDGKYLKKILNKIKNIKNIKYMGKIYNKKVRTLSKNDIFIFPSKTENFGLVVLEALRAGLYVVYNKKLPWTILKKKNFGIPFDFDKKNNINFPIKFLENIKKKIRLKNHKVKIDNFLNKNYNWDLISKKYHLFYKYDK